jgi:HD superfamily phosphohydrolase
VRDRKLFAYADSTPQFNRQMRAKLKKAGYDLNYYWGRDSVMQKPYVPYRGSQESTVWVWMKDGSVRELSNASNIVYSLIHGPVHDDNKVYFPADVI